MENFNQTQVHHRVLIVQVVCINLVVEPLCVLNVNQGNTVQIQVQQFVKTVLVENFQVLDKLRVSIVKQGIFKKTKVRACACLVCRVDIKIQKAETSVYFVALITFPLKLHRHPAKFAVQAELLQRAVHRVRAVALVLLTRTWLTQIHQIPMNVKYA